MILKAKGNVMSQDIKFSAYTFWSQMPQLDESISSLFIAVFSLTTEV